MIDENGKLLKIKHDDAADAAEESKTDKKHNQSITSFTNPRAINHPYLPLANLKEDILVGGKNALERVERTVHPEIHKTFRINGKELDSLTVIDKEFSSGKVIEITRDYFAQDDEGNVYYLGEDVDSYKDGKIVGHDGAWLQGEKGATAGFLLPAKLKLNRSFDSENVPNITTEKDRLISTNETVSVPAGRFSNCLVIEENTSDGDVERKYFAPGVGCVKESESDGDLVLKRHLVR